MATSIMCRTFCEIGTCGLCDVQLDRQTDMLIAVLCTPTGCKVVSTQTVLCWTHHCDDRENQDWSWWSTEVMILLVSCKTHH